jgi:hypothetical protein
LWNLIGVIQEAVRQPSVTGNVPAAEVVQAVRDMLTAAGVPMGSDQSILLEHSLSLQEQLSAVDTALSVEQVTEKIFLCCLLSLPPFQCLDYDFGARSGVSLADFICLVQNLEFAFLVKFNWKVQIHLT